MIRCSDYKAAQTIADSAPEGFDRPGLRGWRSAVGGFLNPSQSVELFSQAAEDFEQDIAPETLEPGQHYSSINLTLWSKYFRGRACVAQIERAPDRSVELLKQAEALLEGTDSGWVNPQVTCFRILLIALNDIAQGDVELGPTRGIATLSREVERSGLGEDDQLIASFLEAIRIAFEQLRHEPTNAMVSGLLPRALAILGRIPLVGEGVASAISPLIGRSAFEQLMGPQRTWMYRPGNHP